jgi:hypothetical protein
MMRPALQVAKGAAGRVVRRKQLQQPLQLARADPRMGWDRQQVLEMGDLVGPARTCVPFCVDVGVLVAGVRVAGWQCVKLTNGVERFTLEEDCDPEDAQAQAQLCMAAFVGLSGKRAEKDGRAGTPLPSAMVIADGFCYVIIWLAAVFELRVDKREQKPRRRAASRAASAARPAPSAAALAIALADLPDGFRCDSV